jgi:tRNA-modifying protein YgfZ
VASGYDALRTGAAWLDLSARGRIYATGEDRARLLHAITTNHVQQLTPGTGCYAFFLNAQGHIQADLNLLCLEDRFLLDTEPETRERIWRHIDKYIIADDVALSDAAGEFDCVAVEGPQAAALLGTIGAPVPEADYAHAKYGDAIIERASSTGAKGFRIFVPAAQKSEWIARLERAGAAGATSEEARVARLEYGRPRYGEDIFENTLPQETRQMHAVHFTKGCYLGQEIVERIRSRGHVNRVLATLAVDTDETLPRGTKITAQDAQAGEITSSAFSPALGKIVALAYLNPHLLERSPLLAQLAAGRVGVVTRVQLGQII